MNNVLFMLTVQQNVHIYFHCITHQILPLFSHTIFVTAFAAETCVSLKQLQSTAVIDLITFVSPRIFYSRCPSV